MKLIVMAIALAAVGLVPTLSQVQASPETEFGIDNSIHINEKCEHDCKYEGDIKQEGSIEYSERTGEPLSDDVLVVNVDDLDNHKVTISAEVLETGANADITVEDYEDYYATFHWYQDRAPLGSTFKACVYDHKTEEESCKTKVHQENPDEMNLHND